MSGRPAKARWPWTGGNRVWGWKGAADVRPMRTIVSRLRRKLGDDADRPAYIFTEPRAG
ncbi:MAG: helix-turn-helix domain-containing protein [Caldilineaceae bacterium]|nr:helix-turn-helix domain-containing protein [Caldilineaceae bacterium]